MRSRWNGLDREIDKPDSPRSAAISSRAKRCLPSFMVGDSDLVREVRFGFRVARLRAWSTWERALSRWRTYVAYSRRMYDWNISFYPFATMRGHPHVR